MPTDKEDDSRQGNAFIRSTLGEISVIGPFFVERSLKKAIPKSIHSSCMLMGGVMIMVMDPFHLKPKTLGEMIGSGVAHMVLGMWLGGITYHAAAYIMTSASSCLPLSRADDAARTPLNP